MVPATAVEVLLVDINRVVLPHQVLNLRAERRDGGDVLFVVVREKSQGGEYGCLVMGDLISAQTVVSSGALIVVVTLANCTPYRAVNSVGMYLLTALHTWHQTAGVWIRETRKTNMDAPPRPSPLSSGTAARARLPWGPPLSATRPRRARNRGRRRLSVACSPVGLDCLDVGEGEGRGRDG